MKIPFRRRAQPYDLFNFKRCCVRMTLFFLSLYQIYLFRTSIQSIQKWHFHVFCNRFFLIFLMNWSFPVCFRPSVIFLFLLSNCLMIQEQINGQQEQISEILNKSLFRNHALNHRCTISLHSNRFDSIWFNSNQHSNQIFASAVFTWKKKRLEHIFCSLSIESICNVQINSGTISCDKYINRQTAVSQFGSET